MQSIEKNKKANLGFVGIVVFIASLVIVGGAATFGGVALWNKIKGNATGDDALAMAGEENIDAESCLWAGQLVDGQFVSKAMFSGSSVDPTFKVWDEEPDGWGNPRESFTYDKDNPYETYSSSGGTVTLSEDPADAPLYVMATLSGYATKFMIVNNGDDGLIPCSTNDDSLSDYNAEPRSEKLSFIQESSLTMENISLGISANGTDSEFTKYVYLAAENDKGFAMWKVTFTANNKTDLVYDDDNDNTYNEGVKVIRLKVGDAKEETLFDPANGIEKIDASTGKYEYVIKAEDYEDSDFYMDGESLPIKVYVKANVVYNSNTSVSNVAGDELLGNTEIIGKLSLMSSEASDLGDVYIKG